MRVFFSAGEASGDRYAAALLAEMRSQGSGFTAEGVGGSFLSAAAEGPVIDSSSWGAISIAQSAKVAWRVGRGWQAAKKALQAGKPGLLIAVDFGFFNIRLCRIARAAGWKVLYFIPPGSWRRDRQGADIPRIADEIVTPFPWSAEIFRSMGAEAHWFGHPLKQLVAQSGPAPASRDRIAVLPGSRKHEVAQNLPVIAEALRDRPETIEFAVAPSLDLDWLRSRWPGEAVFTRGDTYRVLRGAKAAVVCSGTATLEAALCDCPMVVIYRISRAMVLEAKLVRFKWRFISLPNILLDRGVVPELIHTDASPAAIRRHLEGLLAGTEREAQLAAFHELGELLGPSDALTQSAKLALEMMVSG